MQFVPTTYGDQTLVFNDYIFSRSKVVQLIVNAITILKITIHIVRLSVPQLGMN